MKCLRCGYCCINLDVAIVNPESIMPDGTVIPGSCDPIIFKPAGQRCPHLIFQSERAACTIHDFACYRGSSCEQFEQIGRQDDVCVMGAYFKIVGSEDNELR